MQRCIQFLDEDVVSTPVGEYDDTRSPPCPRGPSLSGAGGGSGNNSSSRYTSGYGHGHGRSNSSRNNNNSHSGNNRSNGRGGADQSPCTGPGWCSSHWATTIPSVGRSPAGATPLRGEQLQLGVRSGRDGVTCTLGLRGVVGVVAFAVTLTLTLTGAGVYLCEYKFLILSNIAPVILEPGV